MTCKCGRQTNDPSGVCAICNLKANDPDTIQSTTHGGGSGGTEAQRHRERSTESSVPENRQCSINGCKNPIYSQKKGLCKYHYTRCKIEGCEKYWVRKGLCTKHLREKQDKPAFAKPVQRMLRTKEKGPKQSRRGEITVTKKICCDCKKEYKPTSNVQKRCPECKKIHISEYQKKYKDKISDLQPRAASRRKNHKPLIGNCKCNIEGCKNPIKAKGFCNKHYLQKLNKEGRIGIRKTPSTSLDGKKSQVSWKRKSAGNGNIGADRSGVAEPEKSYSVQGSRHSDLFGIPLKKDAGQAGMTNNQKQEAGIQKGNGLFAQMLHASDLLDKQINSALEDGTIDTKVILDIRFRLGEVVRGSIPA